MAQQKLRAGDETLSSFLGKMDVTRRADAQTLVDLMKRVAKAEPKIWAGSIVGFGNYHYRYASGHEGDCFLTGFAARKTALTVYLTAGVERFPKLLAKLGKHKAGKGCLYIKSLDDVDLSVLEDLVGQSIEWTKTTYKS
jgi:uncharacterized protein DUF1801